MTARIWTLLRQLLDDGVMPALRSLVDGAVTATLESVLPTNSMSAWTSLMTGVNPAKHGLYEFLQRTTTPFETYPTNSSLIRFPTIWETLTGHDFSSCVIDMPPLHPPFPINGVMIGGMGAGASPDSAYVSPPELREMLEREAGGFILDSGWVGRSGQERDVVDELLASVENRTRIAELMLDRGGFDVFSIVFVQTDRVQHMLWQDLIRSGPNFDMAREIYAAIDKAIARLLDQMDAAKIDMLVVSDHGFRALRRILDVNQFLKKEGLGGGRWERPLRAALARRVERLPVPRPVREAIGRALSDGRSQPRWLLPEGALAYSDVASWVNVNLQGRESHGHVPLDQHEAVMSRVAARLLDFRDPQSGQAVTRDVLRREECFHGEYASEAPDLFLDFYEGYGQSLTSEELMWEWPFCQGVHSRAGIIAATGPSFRSGETAPMLSILDVAPTVLALLGVPTPAGIEGRIAQELLRRPLEPASGAAADTTRAAAPAGYSEAEEALVRERLKNLGYLE